MNCDNRYVSCLQATRNKIRPWALTIIFYLTQRKLNYKAYYINRDNDFSNVIIVVIKITKPYSLRLWAVRQRWILWAKGWIVMSLIKIQNLQYYEKDILNSVTKWEVTFGKRV